MKYSRKEVAKILGIDECWVRGKAERLLICKKGERKYNYTEKEIEILRNALQIKKPKIISVNGDITTIDVKGYNIIIDSEDFEKIKDFTWAISVTGSYVVCNYKGKALWFHRLILNAPKGMEVDHINNNKLDNRKCNLRLCNRAENNRNKSKNNNNKSGYKGVCWHKQHRKWYVQITKNRKKHFLGLFTNLQEAHAAYCKAAKELHGEFARAI